MQRVFLTLLVAGFSVAPAAAASDLSVQEALLRTKPAVAIVVSEVSTEVTLNCHGRELQVTPPPFRETGTGWFIGPDGWMITSAHVVMPAYQPPPSLERSLVEKAMKSACPDQAPAAKSAKIKLEPSIFVILSNGIRLNATVAKYSPPIASDAMSGRDLALLHLEAADMPTLALGDSGAARIGDPIHILGFPGVVMTHELLNASAKVEASVTNGAISGFKQDVANRPVIQTDAPAAWGNNGGPAVDPNGRVVGVLTFVSRASSGDGGIVQGFNFVIPAAAVQEFLTGTVAKPGQPSRFNAAWHAGLSAYFSGDYATARKQFLEANRLLPELPDVRRMTAQADDKINHPPPRPFPWALVTAVVTLASAAAFGAIGGARWKRNRFRIPPSEVARLIETASQRPIVLDVRDDETYRKSPMRIPDSLHIAPEQLRQGIGSLGIEAERTVVAYCT
jgi:S1-C subfamily serine protease